MSGKNLNFSSATTIAAMIIGCCMVVYHMAYAQSIFQSTIAHETTHLGFALVLGFLGVLGIRPRQNRYASLYYICYGMLLIASVVSIIYLRIEEDRLTAVSGYGNTIDLIIGVIVIVAVLEATRKSWGMILPLLAVIGLLYLMLGHLVPGYFNHIRFTPRSAVADLVTGFAFGVFGDYMLASADYVFLFVIFGALLTTIGADRFFKEVGKVASNLMTGGAGQAAVVSSGLVGMVTGISAANVAITGSFTIPTMKRQGYRPEHAGAIEAVASTGGQILPPVMGVAVFIMVVLTGIPYIEICKAAAIPAFLYLVATALGVRSLAKKYGIGATSELVDSRLLFRMLPNFVVPLGLLTYLLILRFSVMIGAFWVILATLALGLIWKDTRPSLQKLARDLSEGAKAGAAIAPVCGTIGIIAHVVIATGLAQKLTYIVGSFSGGLLPVALFLVCLVTIILGCGVPTPAAYALVAALNVPMLLGMGLELFSAHVFVLYYAVLSAITPPVAAASLVAAQMAGGKYMKTAWESAKLGLGLYLIPFFFAYNGYLLAQGNDPLMMLLSIYSTVLCLAALQFGIQGYGVRLSKGWERLAYVLAGICLAVHIFTLNHLLVVVGSAIFAAITAWEWRTRNVAIESLSGPSKMV